LNRFVRLPWRLYRDDAAWIPPLEVEIKEFLDRKRHPFYQHGDATAFLAYKENEVVGRILVADDPRYNEQNKTNVAPFGMFECIDDQEVADALFETAAGWARRRGRDAIWGPIDYSTNYCCGLLIDGFETPPRLMMPHHRPYYSQLFENWGFLKNKDLYAWWFQDPKNFAERWRPILDRKIKRSGVTVRPFSRKHFKEEVHRCMEIFDSSRKDWWWACVTMTDAEVEFLVKRLAMFAHTNEVLIAEVDGQAVGFSITMPDVNEAIAPLKGKLTWFGLPVNFLRMMWRLRRVRTARMMVLCVRDGYRKRGIGEKLILESLNYGKHVTHYTGAELSWTDEDNDQINRLIERVGAERYKTYRVYEKRISPAKPEEST
jgi:GNAT superfamily N-acetyltransferase